MNQMMERSYHTANPVIDPIEPISNQKEIEEEDVFFDVGEGSMQSEDRKIFDSE